MQYCNGSNHCCFPELSQDTVYQGPSDQIHKHRRTDDTGEPSREYGLGVKGGRRKCHSKRGRLMLTTRFLTEFSQVISGLYSSDQILTSRCQLGNVFKKISACACSNNMFLLFCNQKKLFPFILFVHFAFFYKPQEIVLFDTTRKSLNSCLMAIY